MTGWECIVEALKVRGYHPSKILGNRDFIEAIITILSDEDIRNEIDLLTAKAQESRRLREEAIKQNNLAERKLKELKMRADETEAQIKELKALQACETAEARDKMRLLAAFKEITPDIIHLTGKAETAYIYSIGAILSSNAIFSNITKESDNN